MSNAFNPSAGLYYVMADESCASYVDDPDSFAPGQLEYGGYASAQQGYKHVRAINLQTGAIAWDKPLTGPGLTFSGVLSMANLVFYGDDNGDFTAVDAASGNTVWTYVTQQTWKASPMTYMVNGKQYVAIAAPGQPMVFALK